MGFYEKMRSLNNGESLEQVRLNISFDKALKKLEELHMERILIVLMTKGVELLVIKIHPVAYEIMMQLFMYATIAGFHVGMRKLGLDFNFVFEELNQT